MNPSKRIYVVALVVVLAAAGIYSAVRVSRTPGVSGTEIFEVQKGTIQNAVSVDVSLAPAVSTDLAFENAGKIKNIYISVGDQVKAGQLLAEEVNSDYAASLRGAVAARNAADAQLKQAREGVDVQKAKLQSLKNADAKKYDVKAQKETKDQALAGVDAQEALLAAAQSAVDEANLQIGKTRLLAPMDGVITDKSIEIGKVVAQASPVMKIASANNLEADAYISELDVKKIAVGDLAEIVLSSVDGNKISFQSKIKNIYPSETVQNGASAYKVVLDLGSQNADLKSGMTGTADIKISEQSDAMVVPQSSIFSDAGKKYVMVMSGGFPERKEVQTGAEGSDGSVEILSGLSAGDKIVKF
jgi:RND family efflux transporter MFP subunit